MKITRRQLRRLIAEAKFTPSRPLDRDAIQTTLGIHPEQIGRNEAEIELKSHPQYEEGKKDLFGFIEINADNYSWDGRSGQHIDDVVANATSFLERLFDNHGHGSRLSTTNIGEFTEQHVELMLQDLFNLGYVTVNTDDMILTTPEGDDWYFST